MLSFRHLTFLCLLSLSLSMPEHGNYKGITLNLSKMATKCVSLTMAKNSYIKVSLRGGHLPKEASETAVTVIIDLYESQCQSIKKDDCSNDIKNKIMSNIQKLNISIFRYNFLSNKSVSTLIRIGSNTNLSQLHNERAVGSGEGSQENTTTSTTIPITIAPDIYINTAIAQNVDSWYTFNTNNSGVYDVVIIVIADSMKSTNFSMIFDVSMRNYYGYLSLVDYPAMIVYSILLVLYIAYAFGWLIQLGLSYKDLVRLQFWILGVILLGFLEKVFFVAEYGTANQGQNSNGLIYIAEGVSAAKRSLARVLLIIVCEGFGTVKPRLGPILGKVGALGIVYFIAAFIDGTIRAYRYTTDSHDLTSMLTFGFLFLLDVGIVYWIFTALINTRRALRIRKNMVKLSLYNHLGYALIATVVASLAFVIWQFIYITRNECTKDWREMWLIDCYWHMLFCFMLLIIMIIWRPSANKLRFAYSQVHNGDSEDEEEQGANKNFETVKMRPVSKLDMSHKPVTSNEAEEDLKWVEENLPTTAIDKAATMILDSEEEVMTTKFEASKLH